MSTDRLSETGLEALARAYDREDAAQRGEPSPWRDPAGDKEWVSERIACAEAAIAAYLSATQAAPVAVMGLEPTVEMSAAGMRVIKNIQADHFHKYAGGIANSIFEAMMLAAPPTLAVPGDVPENIIDNPKSWAAWKREAESWRRIAERLETEKQAVASASASASVSEPMAYIIINPMIPKDPLVKANGKFLEQTEWLYPARREADARGMAKLVRGDLIPLYGKDGGNELR